jgi:hypothetical protein
MDPSLVFNSGTSELEGDPMTITAETTSTFNCDVAVIRIIGAPRATTFKKWTGWMGRGVAGLREVAPYAAIELLLPGGSMVALLLWLYRRYKRIKTREGQRDATVAPLRVLAHLDAIVRASNASV